MCFMVIVCGTYARMWMRENVRTMCISQYARHDRLIRIFHTCRACDLLAKFTTSHNLKVYSIALSSCNFVHLCARNNANIPAEWCRWLSEITGSTQSWCFCSCIYILRVRRWQRRRFWIKRFRQMLFVELVYTFLQSLCTFPFVQQQHANCVCVCVCCQPARAPINNTMLELV